MHKPKGFLPTQSVQVSGVAAVIPGCLQTHQEMNMHWAKQRMQPERELKPHKTRATRFHNRSTNPGWLC